MGAAFFKLCERYPNHLISHVQWNPPSSLSKKLGTLEGTKEQDQNREEVVFAMASHQQARIFKIFCAVTI